jgi:hypothetical protein
MVFQDGRLSFELFELFISKEENRAPRSTHKKKGLQGRFCDQQILVLVKAQHTLEVAN